MTDPIEVLRQAVERADRADLMTRKHERDILAEQRAAAVAAVVRLRDAARRVDEWRERMPPTRESRGVRWMHRFAHDELAAALAPFAQEEPPS